MCFEDFGGEEAAEGPAPEGDVVGVDEVVGLDEVIGGPDLVHGFEDAQVFGDGGAELAALEGTAAVVDGVEDVLQLGVGGDEQVPVGSCVGLGGTLRVGATVGCEHDGVLLRGVKVGWVGDLDVQHVVGVRNRADLGPRDVGVVVFLDSVHERLVRGDGRDGSGAVDAVELLVRDIWTAVVEKIVPVVGGEGCGPPASLGVVNERLLLERSVGNRIKVALGAVALGRGVVDKLTLGIDRKDRTDFPLAAGKGDVAGSRSVNRE